MKMRVKNALYLQKVRIYKIHADLCEPVIAKDTHFKTGSSTAQIN